MLTMPFFFAPSFPSLIFSFLLFPRKKKKEKNEKKEAKKR